MLTFATAKILQLNLGGCLRCGRELNVGDVVLYEHPLAFCSDCATKKNDDSVKFSTPCGHEDYPCCGCGQ